MPVLQAMQANQPFSSLREACTRAASSGCMAGASLLCKPCQSATWLTSYDSGLRRWQTAATAGSFSIR